MAPLIPPTWLERYKTFVRRNRAMLAAVEQGAAGLTWLMPGDHTEAWHLYT